MNVKQYFPMSYDHLIHEMLDHAVDSVDNMRACVIFMASLTGKNLGGPRALCVHAKRQNENKKNAILILFIYLAFPEMKSLGILIPFIYHTIHEY